MSSFVAVLPSIHPPYTWTCLQSMLEPPFWTKVEVEVTLESFAHGIQLGGVHIDPEPLADYFRAKWGGMPSHETFTTPFDSGRSLSYWPERVAA